jgi:zinc-ribbon domain
MSAQYCSHCGAPLPAGAQFCTFCGTAVTGAPGGGVAPPMPPPPPMAGPLPSGWNIPSAPPPRRSRTRVILVIFVVIILIGAVAIVALAFLPSSSTGVDIQGFNIWAPDNACGLNANPIGFSGFNDTPGDVDQLQLSMPNYNSTTCTLVGMVTNTTGFTLSDLGLPLTIPGSPNTSNPVSENLNLTVTMPNSSFNGIVNLVVR